MADYEIVVFCDHCSKAHSLGLVVALDGPPADPDSIGNLYKGKELPKEVVDALSLRIHCHETKQNVTITDPQKQAFLVATEGRKVVGKTFENERVIMDHRSFDGCVFKKCDIMMLGGPFGANNCDFQACQFLFCGAAAGGLLILDGFRKGLPDIYNGILKDMASGTLRINPKPAWQL